MSFPLGGPASARLSAEKAAPPLKPVGAKDPLEKLGLFNLTPAERAFFEELEKGETTDLELRDDGEWDKDEDTEAGLGLPASAFRQVAYVNPFARWDALDPVPYDGRIFSKGLSARESQEDWDRAVAMREERKRKDRERREKGEVFY
ncbi:hypothetical protein P7C73_g5758, partial [Tremellales sp. Uapishka_1]